MGLYYLIGLIHGVGLAFFILIWIDLFRDWKRDNAD